MERTSGDLRRLTRNPDRLDVDELERPLALDPAWDETWDELVEMRREQRRRGESRRDSAPGYA